MLVAATPSLRSKLGAYVSLTKPQIIELLLVTTVPTQIVAERGMPSLWLVVTTVVGGALAAGGAHAINMYVDRDIDRLMARTAHRPLVTGVIEPRNALVFAVVLEVLAFALLWSTVNLLSAVLALGACLFYVFVYTIWLKRTSTQNIVIGGAAGAAPPVLGWAAVTGSVTPDALLLFLIIFAWTPPHFWALALYREKEYGRAGIPMLPVTHGSAFTRLHILLYTILLTAVTIMPYATRLSGNLYLVGALILNGLFLLHAWRLHKTYSDAQARRTFVYSIQYLSALFALLLIDHYRFYYAEALQSALY